MCTQVVALETLATGRIQQKRVIGEIVGHQQSVPAVAGNDSKSRRIRNCLPLWQSLIRRQPLAGPERLQRNLQKAKRRDPALFEAIHSNAVARIAWMLACSVGK